MIEPQRAGVPHIRAQQRDEWLIAFFFQLARIVRSQAPVLTCGLEQIRRRADVDAGERQRLITPTLRSGRICSDGKVPIQTDSHAVTRRGRGCKLTIGLPLQPGTEREFLRMRIGERDDGGRGRILKLRGPLTPIRPGFIKPREMLSQHLKETAESQGVALLRAKRFEFLPFSG